jgi:hypothetical protein
MAQSHPGWASTRADHFWQSIGRKLIIQCQKERKLIYAKLLRERKNLGLSTDLFEPTASEIQTRGKYGVLPEVYVDYSSGAIFPAPISAPHRFSWYQLNLMSGSILRKLRKFETHLERFFLLPREQKKTAYEQIAAEWIGVNSLFIVLAQQIRYLNAWLPQLEIHQNSFEDRIIQSFFDESADPTKMETLREDLKPHRVIKRSFLPDRLVSASAGVIVLPITTDVTDKNFLLETEGALDTHWNQSFWAKSHQVSFYIRWIPIQKNLAFTEGKETLVQHLLRFPTSSAGLTTGGLTTHVHKQILVLGPGKIRPRTLAHEIGHLLGFDDCYLRTLSGQNIFGRAILEWDNPIYPDDLMCDNMVGEPHVEVW